MIISTRYRDALSHAFFSLVNIVLNLFPLSAGYSGCMLYVCFCFVIIKINNQTILVKVNKINVFCFIVQMISAFIVFSA